MLIPDQPLIRKNSYLINWYHAVLALTPVLLQTLGFMRWVGLGVKSMTYLRFVFVCSFFFYGIIRS